jgi:SAM-dependent methyltransferase
MTSELSPHTGSSTLDPILERMRCPRCAGALSVRGESVACESGHTFPVRDGVPLLAILGTAETWAEASASETSADYQREYQEVKKATQYNEAYRDRPTKRWSTEREYRLLERHLGSRPRAGLLLDIPSGGGRLSGVISRYADLLVEADIGLGQILYGRERARGTVPEGSRIWITASAFHIPFKDRSVDGVVCCRLCHHLPTADERERLVAELLRVARDFVVMTFFDYHSVKNYIRRARRPFNHLPPKMTMTVDRVASLARTGGAELVAAPALSHLFSGHRYALMVKR